MYCVRGVRGERHGNFKVNLLTTVGYVLDGCVWTLPSSESPAGHVEKHPSSQGQATHLGFGSHPSCPLRTPANEPTLTLRINGTLVNLLVSTIL